MISTLKSWEPATGELLGEVAVSSPEEVAQTIARAKKAQAAWPSSRSKSGASASSAPRRARRSRGGDRRRRHARVRQAPHDALTEVMVAVDQLTYYCNNAKTILASRELPLHLLRHKKSVLHYVPRGVVGVISPGISPSSSPWPTSSQRSSPAAPSS